MNAWLSPDWNVPNQVRAFTTLRNGAGRSEPPFDRFNLGNFQAADGDDPKVVEHNRSELIERLALPSPPHWLRQVHGTRAVRIESASKASVLDNAHEADAAVTSAVDVVLTILTADCLPVLFAADDGTEVAVAHAGWRGLVAGVLESTVAAMNTAPENLVAWMGPAAGPHAYEVGAEVYEAFVKHDRSAASAFLATRESHWHIDLYALAQMRLNQIGVHRVSGGNFCTISDSARFYSHRRQNPTGRMATLIYRAD